MYAVIQNMYAVRAESVHALLGLSLFTACIGQPVWREFDLALRAPDACWLNQLFNNC